MPELEEYIDTHRHSHTCTLHSGTYVEVLLKIIRKQMIIKQQHSKQVALMVCVNCLFLRYFIGCYLFMHHSFTTQFYK